MRFQASAVMWLSPLLFWDVDSLPVF